MSSQGSFNQSSMKWTSNRDQGYLGDVDPRHMKESLLTRARQGARTVRELDNRINLNWVVGRPWYRRLPDTSRVIGLNPDRRQNFVYANLAFDVVRALTGLMHYSPSVEASPRSVDQEDVARAHVARDVAQASIENGRLSKAYRSVLDMNHTYGHAYIKVAWNPLAGQRTPLIHSVQCPQCQGQGMVMSAMGPAGCPQCTAQGQIYTPQGAIPAVPGVINSFKGLKPEGDVSYTPVHPDDVYTDPDAASPEEAEELAHLIRMSPESAWRTYGEPMGIPYEVFEGAPTTNTLWSSYDTANVVALMRPTSQRYIQVIEYYRKPTEKLPEGLFAVFLGDLELFSGPLPYLHDTQAFPFFYFPLYQMQGVYYPLATLDIVLPLIVAFNDHLSTKNARARLSAKLRMMYPVESQMKVDDTTGNLVYRDRPGRNKPETISLAPYPQDAQDMQTVLQSFIERLSGATEVARGESQNADSARALTFLEERAMGPLKPIISDHATRLDAVIKYGLDLCRLFYDDGRIIRRSGATSGVEMMAFRAENVGESTDIQIKSVRDVGRSRSALMTELNEAFKLGALDQATYLSLSEFGDMGKVHQERRVHEDIAMQENQMLVQQQQMPSPIKYQEHDVHMKIHGKKLAEMQIRNPQDPLIPYLVLHNDYHTQLKAQQQVELQMAQQQAMMSFGAANAADPNAQPASTVAAAQQAGPPVTGSEPVPPAPSAAGQAPAYGEAAAEARTYDQPRQG